MPWNPPDAKRHTRKATGPLASLWSNVANQVLGKTGDDARAIREANAVVKRAKKK